MSGPPSWMTADRAEQEATGTRPQPPRRLQTSSYGRMQEIIERNNAARRGTNVGPYIPTETGAERPNALTHEQWLAYQNGEEENPMANLPILEEYANEEAPQQPDPQNPNGTVLVPNINSTNPLYTNRLLPTEAQRMARSGQRGVPGAETFLMTDAQGNEWVETAEYYSYTNLSAENAKTGYYDLPQWAKDQFEATANTLGRYEGEISPTSVYESLLVESKERAMQGQFVSPEELLFEYISEGKLSAGVLPGEEDESGGGGSYGGGGYGGYGGGGGGTVQLTTPQQARYYIQQAYRSLLGRTPTDSEIDEFVTVLRQAELANPQTTEMVGGVAAVTGGFEPQILAEQMARAEEDYKTRGNFNYYNVFMDILGGA